jgi:hypothetical protein
MNNLLSELRRLGWSPTQALNILQDRGIVSDNCVTFKDISEPDLTRAVKWLKTVD